MATAPQFASSVSDKTPLRDRIIALARQQDPDIGDEAMIVAGEWHYCVAGSIFVSKKSVRALQFPTKA